MTQYLFPPPPPSSPCACGCATCHVCVDAAWTDRLLAKSELEIKMLNFAVMVKPTSRMSCRLIVCPEIEGLSMCIPESQH
ncbi:hypothetical protein [Rhodoferax sp.]|uniref:hypothetical protein n=1 Tax=Rhodoferax sp. TaxID=50421 RepID=UPI00261E384C|nr:hypothetical protein [Rhodoferax sp.]MDD2808962.1 hypothetical protein [Rhodoferax sp.]